MCGTINLPSFMGAKSLQFLAQKFHSNSLYLLLRLSQVEQ